MAVGAGVQDGVDGAVVEIISLKKVIIPKSINPGYTQQLTLVSKDWSGGTIGSCTLFDFKLK